jgi:hypothetical protein
MKWNKLLASGFKLIYYPEIIKETILFYVGDAEIILDEVTNDTAFIDYPGPCFINRKTWIGKLSSGLSVEMPISDFHSFLHRVNNAKIVKIFDASYFKLFGANTGIIMPLDMLEELKELMLKDSASIEKMAAEENKRLSERLRDLQTKNIFSSVEKKNFEWN